MAYKTEIQIGVKGVAELDKLRKQVTSLNQKVDGIENAFSKGIQSVKRYSDAVRVASDTLRKARINTQDETDAIKSYVTAVTAANAVQVRQNRLLDQEIAKRGGATRELKKYNAAAAGPRQPGSMTARYLRSGSTAPQGPDTAADFMQRTDAAAKAALRQASAFTVATNEAKKFARAQLEVNNAAFLQRTETAAAAAKRQAAAFIVEKNEAKALAKAQLELNNAAFLQKTEAAAQASRRKAAAFIVERNEAKKLAKVQLELNNAAFLQRTDAAAAAAKRQTAEYLAQARAARILANEQKRLMNALPKGVPTTAHKKPIGPQPKGAKSGANSALQTAGEFGLGTGFPLLFGGGAGQVLGGGLGTALAGAFDLAGQAAMGLQIGLSAIIGKAEELITRFKDVGNAINSLSMDAIADSFITVTEGARTLVRQLVEAGNAQAAVSVAANETFKQTGVLPEAVGDITNNLNLLSNVWDEVVAAVSGLVSIISAPFLTALTAVLKVVGMAVKGVNLIASGIGIALKRAVELINKVPFLKPIIDGIANATKGIVEDEEKSLATLIKKTEELGREFAQNKKLANIEKDRTKGKTAAEKLVNAGVDHRLESEKLSLKTQADKNALNVEFGHLTGTTAKINLAYAKIQIDNNAKLKQDEIDKTLELKKQTIELDRQKEQLKVKIEQHKIAQGEIQAQTTLLEGQVEIFNLQAQAAQSVFAVTQARNKSELSALKLEESRLQRQLARLQKIDGFYTTQGQLINKIAANRKKQAEIEFKVTQQSIKQMVAKAELERQAVRFQVQKINLQIELLRLQAIDIEDTQKRLEKLAQINQQAKISAEVAKQMTITGDKMLESAREIAKFQQLSARHLRDGKLESIEAERVDAQRAVHAAAIARSAKAASSATSSATSPGSGFGGGSGGGVSGTVSRSLIFGGPGRTTDTMSTKGPISDEVMRSVMSRTFRGPSGPADLINALNEGMGYYGDGGHVSGAQLAMIGEKGPEYVVPEKKAAAFATNYLMGARGTAAIPRYAEGGYTGSINIQTGPVMQQDNQMYLTMGQFEEGMRELTESLARGGRSYGSRQFQGVS